MNWKTDYYDRGHANIYGAQKYTDCLIDILSEEVEFSDHMNKPEYESWDGEADRLNQFLKDIEKSRVSSKTEYRISSAYYISRHPRSLKSTGIYAMVPCF